MTENRAEKQAARRLSEELDIRYTLALRLLRTVWAQDPKASGHVLRNRCKDLMKREQDAADEA